MPPHAEPVRAHYVRPRKKTTAPGAEVLAELRRLATPRPQAFAGQSVLQQVGQGLLQPLYAAGLLGRHRDLLAQALVPALLLFTFCLGYGFFAALLNRHAPGILWP